MKSWSKTGLYSYKLFLGSLIYKHLWPERIWVASSVDLGYTYSSHWNGLNKGKLGRIITALFLVLLQQLFTVWWTLAEQVNLIWGLLAPSSYNNSLNNFLYKHKAFDKDLPYTYTSIFFFIYIQYTKFGYDWFASSLQRDRRKFFACRLSPCLKCQGSNVQSDKVIFKKVGDLPLF